MTNIKDHLSKYDGLDFYEYGEEVRPLPSGVASLDEALGIGGYPRGRIIDIYGEESVGKTTLANICIAALQARGERAAVIDVEHAYSFPLAEMVGVDLKKLDLIRPPTGEIALDVMLDLLTCGDYALVLLDSVAALVAQAEMESAMDDTQIAPIARMMAKLLKKSVHAIYSTQSVAMFINQTRHKPMVMFGKTTQATGGKAIKFYASIILEVKRNEYLKDSNKKIVGNRMHCYIEKNKCAAPFQTAEFDFYYGRGAEHGVDNLGAMIDMAIKQGFIKKQGSSWYVWKDKKYNGKKALAVVFEDIVEFDELYDALELGNG